MCTNNKDSSNKSIKEVLSTALNAISGAGLRVKQTRFKQILKRCWKKT